MSNKKEPKEILQHSRQLRKQYGDMLDWLDSLNIPYQIFDVDGVYRFREVTIIRNYIGGVGNGAIDLNSIAVATARGTYTVRDRAEFYTLIGYSLSGFWDIFADAIDEFASKRPTNEPRE